MKVYKAIAAVMADLSKEGIGKDRVNDQQKYKFRGIDDVLNALSPLLASHGLIILPWCLSRICEERESSKGGRLAYVTVEVEFDFISAEDGSAHTIRTIGEAMDSADKATNKAMSAAYKYACILAFCIPVEGAEDADKETPEVKVHVAQDRIDNVMREKVLRHQLKHDEAAELKAKCAEAGVFFIPFCADAYDAGQIGFAALIKRLNLERARQVSTGPAAKGSSPEPAVDKGTPVEGAGSPPVTVEEQVAADLEKLAEPKKEENPK